MSLSSIDDKEANQMLSKKLMKLLKPMDGSVEARIAIACFEDDIVLDKLRTCLNITMAAQLLLKSVDQLMLAVNDLEVATAIHTAIGARHCTPSAATNSGTTTTLSHLSSANVTATTTSSLSAVARPTEKLTELTAVSNQGDTSNHTANPSSKLCVSSTPSKSSSSSNQEHHHVAIPNHAVVGGTHHDPTELTISSVASASSFNFNSSRTSVSPLFITSQATANTDARRLSDRFPVTMIKENDIIESDSAITNAASISTAHAEASNIVVNNIAAQSLVMSDTKHPTSDNVLVNIYYKKDDKCYDLVTRSTPAHVPVTMRQFVLSYFKETYNLDVRVVLTMRSNREVEIDLDSLVILKHGECLFAQILDSDIPQWEAGQCFLIRATFPSTQILHVCSFKNPVYTVDSSVSQLQSTVVYRSRCPSIFANDMAVKFGARGKEQRILQYLQGCPGVVPVVFLGECQQSAHNHLQYVIGMPLLESLQSLCKSGYSVNDSDRLAYAQQLIVALDAIHQRGVIHRDIKPANILIARSQRCVYVCDFDCAVFDNDEAMLHSGRNSSFVGTRKFASENALAKGSPCPNDDYESLCYAIFWLGHAAERRGWPRHRPSLSHMIDQDVAVKFVYEFAQNSKVNYLFAG